MRNGNLWIQYFTVSKPGEGNTGVTNYTGSDNKARKRFESFSVFRMRSVGFPFETDCVYLQHYLLNLNIELFRKKSFKLFYGIILRY